MSYFTTSFQESGTNLENNVSRKIGRSTRVYFQEIQPARASNLKESPHSWIFTVTCGQNSYGKLPCHSNSQPRPRTAWRYSQPCGNETLFEILKIACICPCGPLVNPMNPTERFGSTGLQVVKQIPP